MKKIIIAYCILQFCSCSHSDTTRPIPQVHPHVNPDFANEVKQGYLRLITGDSFNIRMGRESGMLEKIQNAPTYDSVLFYVNNLINYQDSVMKQDSIQKRLK
jgi:hypothetical protein